MKKKKNTKIGVVGVAGRMGRAIARLAFQDPQITINGGARGTGAPFGGYKTSGNGREHGIHGMEDFLETKALIFPQAS